MKTNSPKTATKKKAIKPAKKAAKKKTGKFKSSMTGRFMKPEVAKDNQYSSYQIKPSKNDGKIRLIKKILKSEYMDFIKLAKIEELVYKK